MDVQSQDAQSRWAHVVADVMVDAIAGLSRERNPAIIIATRLGEELHADVTTYGHVDLPSGACVLRTWPDTVVTDRFVEVSARMPHGHPVLDYWLAGHTGVASVSSLGTDRAAWRRSEAYTLLQRGPGCRESAGIRLDRGRQTLHMILFDRHRDFTAAELALLALMRRPSIVLSRHAEWVIGRSGPDWVGHGLLRGGALDLTDREMQVLRLLADGLLASTIAWQLDISTRTVHRHLAHIYAKLDTHDRLTTVIRARDLGVLHGTEDHRAPTPPVRSGAAGPGRPGRPR